MGEIELFAAMIVTAILATIVFGVGQLSVWERIRRRFLMPRDIGVLEWLELQELRLRSAEACLEMYALEIRSLDKEETDGLRYLRGRGSKHTLLGTG